MKQVKYKEWDCSLEQTTYKVNKRIGLQLYDNTDGALVAFGTVNLPDETLEEKEIIVNNNVVGMYNLLLENQVISEAKRWVKSGYVIYPVCDLLI